ncbi:PilZ domain-containing protein [Desulfonema ishimotonii]|nr:PilZ domain-containing protein [Desulfonema ishimotonii]
MTEKRKYERVSSLNLSYVCTDQNGQVVSEGMGRTLNVSESGILLETSFCIISRQRIALTIAMGEDLVDLKGRVIRCQDCGNGIFHTGIEFREIGERDRQVLLRYIHLVETGEIAD